MIPSDIDRTATDIVRAICPKNEDPDWFLYERIAQALNEERERCAALVVRATRGKSEYPTEVHEAISASIRKTGDILAKAIRTPSQAQLNGEGEGK